AGVPKKYARYWASPGDEPGQLEAQVLDLAPAFARDPPQFAPQRGPFLDADFIPSQDCREPRRRRAGSLVSAERCGLPDNRWDFIHLRFSTAIRIRWRREGADALATVPDAVTFSNIPSDLLPDSLKGVSSRFADAEAR